MDRPDDGPPRLTTAALRCPEGRNGSDGVGGLSLLPGWSHWRDREVPVPVRPRRWGNLRSRLQVVAKSSCSDPAAAPASCRAQRVRAAHQRSDRSCRGSLVLAPRHEERQAALHLTRWLFTGAPLSPVLRSRATRLACASTAGFACTFPMSRTAICRSYSVPVRCD